jgi:DNA-binding NarL/FixJ family response regulator
MQHPKMKEPIKILFVDDDEAFLKSAKQILTLHGTFEIQPSYSVAEALEKMKQTKTDVIVCDIQMPEKDGFEFLKMLRKENNRTPFIVFTVTDDKETALKAFSLGANGFVGKYGDPKTVFETLQRCIEKSVTTAQCST